MDMPAVLLAAQQPGQMTGTGNTVKRPNAIIRRLPELPNFPWLKSNHDSGSELFASPRRHEREKTDQTDRSTRWEAHPSTSPYDENDPDGARPQARSDWDGSVQIREG